MFKRYHKSAQKNHISCHTYKSQLTIALKFMSSKQNDEEFSMHFGSDNIEIMINYKEDEVVEEHFQWLCSRYQVGLET